MEHDDLNNLLKLLNERERYWISKFDTYQKGYNCDLGGNSKIVSEHTKELIRMHNIGKKHSESTKRKLSESLSGKPKTKGNYGTSRIGKVLSMETRVKISNTKLEKNLPSPRKGVKLSDETKAKLSKAHLGKSA